jgi:hypothetical protein
MKNDDNNNNNNNNNNNKNDDELLTVEMSAMLVRGIPTPVSMTPASKFSSFSFRARSD